MSGNAKTARQQFRAFSTRPGMFVVDTYEDVASFISGMDYAYNHELLDGFEPWIQEKLGSRSPLAWSEYVKDRFDALTDEQKRPFGEDRKRFLFAYIDQFFRETDAKVNGSG